MTREEILALRARLGMSQSQMAQRLGTTVTTISRWERGEAKPRGLYLKALGDLAKRTK